MHVIKHIDRHKYKNYSSEDLFQDDYFISSATNPTVESDSFWEDLLRNNTIKREEYDQACYLVHSLQTKTDLIFSDEITHLWNDIDNEVRRREKNRKRMRLFRWSLGSIASLVLAVILYGRYATTTDTEECEPTHLPIEAVKAPETPVSEIRLILGDEQIVAVEGVEADIVYGDEGIAINNDERKRIKKPSAASHVTYNQLVVPNGKHSTLTFEDGSKIWVNAGTRIVYPANFAEDKREIYVDGEAYLEVSHDKTRPFTVRYENLSVDVLGTSFNIMAYENDSCQYIVLVSGAVSIRSDDHAETILSPAEMYFSENGRTYVKAVRVEDYTSWRKGIYQYKSERLDVILNGCRAITGKKSSACRKPHS